jgi:hypothetical protein
MQTITTIGLDIAKSVFQVHGVDAAGEVVIRRQLKRRSVLAHRIETRTKPNHSWVNSGRLMIGGNYSRSPSVQPRSRNSSLLAWVSVLLRKPRNSLRATRKLQLIPLP